MRAIVGGKEGKLVLAFKDTNTVALPIVILEDTGAPHDLSTATVDLVLYSRSDRNVTATATHAVTVTTAADGKCALSVDDSVMTYAAGDYYGFIRRTLSGAVTFCKQPIVWRVR